MESAVFPDEANERKAVRIVGSELVVENYTVCTNALVGGFVLSLFYRLINNLLEM